LTPISVIAFRIAPSLAQYLVTAAGVRTTQRLVVSGAERKSDAGIAVVWTVHVSDHVVFAVVQQDRKHLTANCAGMRFADWTAQFRFRAAVTDGALGVVSFAAGDHAKLIVTATVFERCGLRETKQRIVHASLFGHCALDDFVVLGDRFADWAVAFSILARILAPTRLEPLGTTAFATDALAVLHPALVFGVARFSEHGHFSAHSFIVPVVVITASLMAVAEFEYLVVLTFSSTQTVLGNEWEAALTRFDARRGGVDAKEWLLADGGACLILVRSWYAHQALFLRSEPLQLRLVSIIALANVVLATDRVRVTTTVAFRVVLTPFANVFENAFVIAALHVLQNGN